MVTLDPDTVKKFSLPDDTVNKIPDGATDAVTDPVAILDKFKPTIPDAGTLVNPPPSPSNDPENEPDAIPTKDPVKDPVVKDCPIVMP